MFEEHRNAILKHAASEAPNEAVGVISDGKYVPLKNVHEDPEAFFALSDKDTAKYILSGKCDALVHSHPGDVIEHEDGSSEVIVHNAPSRTDMQQQIKMGVPWVIAYEDPQSGTWRMFDWGKHTLDLPILERPFIHGVEDCYELIRKYEWQVNGVLLDSFPRDDFWWARGEETKDLYLENFESQGYQRVHPESPADLVPGDVFLYKLFSTRYNHGGVYPGNGLLWHHPPSKLSCPVPLGPMFRRVDVWLRREKNA